MVDPLIISTGGCKFTPDQINRQGTAQGQISATFPQTVHYLGSDLQVSADKKIIVTNICISIGSTANVTNMELFYADNADGTTNAVYWTGTSPSIRDMGASTSINIDTYWEVPANKYISINNSNTAGWEMAHWFIRFVEVAV